MSLEVVTGEPERASTKSQRLGADTRCALPGFGRATCRLAHDPGGERHAKTDDGTDLRPADILLKHSDQLIEHRDWARLLRLT
jgi:hypothetical protein